MASIVGSARAAKRSRACESAPALTRMPNLRCKISATLRYGLKLSGQRIDSFGQLLVLLDQLVYLLGELQTVRTQSGLGTVACIT